MMEEIGTKDITRVIDALIKYRCIDFSNYAFSSFKRRIVRFLEINKIRDLDLFIDQIKNDKAFSESLVKEITVNVTEMFRDPSFWIILRENIIPAVRIRRPIKIWHAACSTGEEVFSMAIMLKEADLLKHSAIVATDINSDVIDSARKGIYSLKSQETNIRNYNLFGGQKLLTDYYSVIDSHAVYDRSLIEKVDFKCHNLAQDGPVDNFDLILCRNVLIYFNSELQEKVVQSFVSSMSKGSYLGIGSKESIEWSRTYGSFSTENFDEKIYRKIN